MFNSESGLVKTWVSLIKKGVYKLDQVPEIANLKEVVQNSIAK